MKTCPTCRNAYPDDFSHCPSDGAHLTAQATETEAQLAAGLSRRFRLIRRLGKGGMGTVFLAEQIGVGNRPVALKVLNRKLLDDPDFLLRFQNEAGSTGRIHHPNVVTIYESDLADDGTPYIAMEFLEGESLRELVKKRGALPVGEVVEITQQVADGLDAAHDLGIIHRDLKPDNIFLTRDKRGRLVAKVVDFGIAKLRESATHTQTGMVLGTPAYMSYEQASGMRSDELDGRSDIYSLGVVVYEMLSGRVPFHSDTPLGYLRKHMLEEPPALRTVARGLDVPPGVERAVMKALVKDRNLRYASVLDFARELAGAAQLSAPAETTAPLPSTRMVSPSASAQAAWEHATPAPPPAAAKARDDIAGQPPSPAPAEKIVQTPLAPPRVSKPAAAASRTPAALRMPQFQAATDSPSRVKLIVLGLVLLAVIAGSIWYFSQSGPEPIPNGTSPSSSTAVPPKPEPRVEPPAPNISSAPLEAKVNPTDGLKYVWIPPGTFMMGCSPGDNECQDVEKPPHQVTLTKGFWLGQTEVTVGAYKRFTAATGRQMPPEPSYGGRPLNPGWGDDAMPIANLVWDDAQAYCRWAGARLPTEAEYEYAARAGTTTPRYGDLDEIAWEGDNSGLQRLDSFGVWNENHKNYPKRLAENGNGAHDVGQKRANDFGLYDMLGNVWVWLNDWYDEKFYQGSPPQDPAGPTSGKLRALRGGSWDSPPWIVRASFRGWFKPTLRRASFGVRCGGEVFAP
jgi:serine/threonine-protein kinase